MNRPRFEIVCNHGIDGGDLARVATLEWVADGDYWYMPSQFTPTESVSLVGDRLATSMPSAKPTRSHHEFICPVANSAHRDINGLMCTRRPYRTDQVKVTRLFVAISTDERLRQVAVAATDAEITMSLDGLHAARHAAKSLGLNV